MKLYTVEQIQDIDKHVFAFLKVEKQEHVLIITLDRARKKNALHPQMVNEIAFAFHYAYFEKTIRVILIQAKGSVFCAGGDLKAMAGIIEPNDSSIPAPVGKVLIGNLFNQVHKPIITKLEGHVFAGGFFFLAGSHYVVSLQHVILGLPEVKRGLYPMQVMEALLRVLPARKVLDWCMRGYNLPIENAYDWGLVTHLATPETIGEEVNKIIHELVENSPTAIRLGLEAFDYIQQSEGKHAYLSDMLGRVINSKDGQEGLQAFREKRKPVWTGK